MAIPNNYGGDRAFLEDPEQAGAAAALGDVAALQLQMIHLLRAQLGNQEADRMAKHLRNSMTVADAHKTRENSTRELQPMNTIPGPNGYGNTNN